MTRLLAFSERTVKEIVRDPLNVCFGLGFPLVLILMLSAIQANVPVELFALESLTPGVTVFGLSFITLFAALLVSKDRESAFLQRLYTTPLTAVEFIAGYALPLVPMALAQSAVCYAVAAVLGLPVTLSMVWAVLFNLPTAVFYVALGLLCGSVLGVKQVGGLCGALLTNVSAWVSGIWFDVALIGGAFERVANVLPFIHAVELERTVLMGDLAAVPGHLAWVLGYTVVTTVLAVVLFLRQMGRG